MNKHNGFTLVELMIVVAIIGIIGAVGFPSYDSYMKKGKRADAKVGLTKLADKQERYYLQNNTYTIDVADLNTSATSDEGYYTFSMAAAPAGLVSGYTLTATQVADTDTDCKTMSLTSTGLKTSTNTGGVDSSDICW